MAHDGGGSPQDLVVQTWTMYSIAMVLFLLRMYVVLKMPVHFFFKREYFHSLG
jgi:hypothetical protein